jgi:3-dehydroquinate dehydratase I
VIKYCLPIIEGAKGNILELVDRNRGKYHYFEVWLDYVADLDLPFVRELSGTLGDRLIVLFRRQGLEKISLPLEKRCEIISELARGESYLDLDLVTQPEELEFMRRESLSLRTILSYHNYHETPPPDALRKLVARMRKNHAAICKVATMCNAPEDAMTLLSLLLELRHEPLRFLVLGMGEYGAPTRIFGTLWGNEMIFAPLSRSAESAPGQLTRDELERVFEVIGGK